MKEKSDYQNVQHILVINDQRGKRVVALEANSHSIGREMTNSIVLYSPHVSRQHALLLRITTPNETSFRFWLVDGNYQGKSSTNGLKVNGENCASSLLQHGDSISFGQNVDVTYYTVSKSFDLTEEEFLHYCAETDLSELCPDGASNPKTPVIPISALDTVNQAAIVRLASFPEIIPSPILEVDLAGKITYLNPAATHQFPTIQALGIQHPVLEGLLSAVLQSPNNIFVREIVVENSVYEQSIHYIAESDLIRCCLFDITGLRRRDLLLQGVTSATTGLLADVGFEAAIAKAIGIMGLAAGVDRVYIYQNHPHPETGDEAMSLQYEWTREGISPKLNQPHHHNQLYASAALRRWYHSLTDEQAIQGLTRNLAEAERQRLEQDGVLSILIVPIIVNCRLWGTIGFDNCTIEYQWSQQEETILFAMAASISAAVQRQQAEELIRHQAFHDSLTALPNRVLFSDCLEQALLTTQRTKKLVGIMFIDLDHFKAINDALGHTLGDQLLREVANRLCRCVRASDTVARWGGDEFIILLPEVSDLEQVDRVAQRILHALKTPFYIREHELFIGTSIGVAVYPNDGDRGEILIQNADVALYKAKEQGRGNCQMYTPAMNSQATELFAIENNLRHALERGEFSLFYQPKVNIKTGQIIGMEALIRWQHPEMGLISPGTFIPIAESNGLIVPIGEWVLHTACAQTKLWHEAGYKPLTVAVNLSARQFYQPNLSKVVAQTLAQTGLEPTSLELEVTETIAIQDLNTALIVLGSLQNLGVKIAMDDFGTGYSSLNSLKQLPLDTLKIDQSFIRELGHNPKDAEIVNTVISLARSLSLNVVAEGVDNLAQLKMLQSMQCGIVQGYLFYQPLPVARATESLQEAWLLSS